jgi:alkaline phosphatase D
MQGLVVLCLLWSASVHAASLTHGPLLGNVTPSSAVVWVRTSAVATVAAELLGNVPGATGSSIQTAEGSDFTAQLALTGLPPATMVSYRVKLNGVVVTPVKQFRTAPPIGAATTMRLPVFSDWSRSQRFPGLATAIAQGADAVMFLGDFDHRNPVTLDNMRNMHKSLRSTSTRLGEDVKAGLIDATVQVPLYHVWDDHDMRGDNANKNSGHIPEARQAFREYYPMPSDAGPGTAIYQKFSFAHVDVFILDLRSERDPGQVPDDGSKSMLGLVQKAWFKAALLASTADWKVIMSSVPWNPTSKNGDAWKGFPTEQNELKSFIESNEITGVLFASGDLHLGGALDDGSHSYFPEANCPKANDTFNHTGKPGKWSHGFSQGGVGAGFCEFVLTPTKATINIVGDDGTVRRTLECKAGQIGKCKAP